MAERIIFPEKNEGVIFLVVNHGECLIETRIKKGSGFYGHNRVPGGVIEEDETPPQAVFREVFEEAGLICRKVICLGIFEEMNLNKRFIRLHAFLINDYSGEVYQVDIEKQKSILTWVNLEAAEKCLNLASSKLTLSLAKAELSRQNT